LKINKKVLKDEELKELFKEYHSEETSLLRKERIREIIVNANLGFVYTIALRYNFFDDDLLQDLVSEGMMGMIKAIDLYDYKKGVKFTSYSFFHIRQKIILYIKTKIDTIRIPAGLTERDKYNGRTDSLNLLLETKSFQAIDKTNPIDDLEIKMIIKDIFNKFLNEKERKLLEKHYGLNNEARKTLKQIGIEMGITRERVRQIEARAMSKIRTHIINSNILNRKKEVILAN
jgi:RNA polymerase sigma factor (sigma-70 family)